MYLVFGGTFNPVHLGHLAWCEVLHLTFNNATINLLPSFNAQHKQSSCISAEHRINMIKLAIEPLPFCTINLQETHAKKACFTFETLEAIQPKPSTTVLVIGADQWHQWHQWCNTDRILKTANLLVLPRPGHSLDTLPFWTKTLWQNKPRGQIAKLPGLSDTKIATLTSSHIRQAFANGACQHYGLPQKVNCYIQDHQLYKEPYHANT